MELPHVIHDEISVEVRDVVPHEDVGDKNNGDVGSVPQSAEPLRKVDAVTVGPVEQVLGEKGERALAHFQRRGFYTSLDGNQHGMAEYVDRKPQGQNNIYFTTIPPQQWPVNDTPPLRAEVVFIESEAMF